MCDFSEAEMNAIEDIFPGIIILICDFHQEQAWERWVKKGEHGVAFEDRVPLLSCLRSVAYARTSDELKQSVEALKKNKVYHQPKVQHWMETQWFPHIKRWCHLYRNNDSNLIINTNNGLERQNKVLKYDYLAKYNDHSVAGMLLIVHTQYLPNRFKRYKSSNLHLSKKYRSYNKIIPTWLHVMKKMFAADDYVAGDVVPNPLSTSCYQVKSRMHPLISGTQLTCRSRHVSVETGKIIT